MYMVESIAHTKGQYLPGTEVEKYCGNDKEEARRVFDVLQETENFTIIGSEYTPVEDRWEIIWEK